MDKATAVNTVLASYTGTPELLFQRLDANQFKLYGLIDTFQQCHIVARPEFARLCAEEITDLILAACD